MKKSIDFYLRILIVFLLVLFSVENIAQIVKGGSLCDLSEKKRGRKKTQQDKHYYNVAFSGVYSMIPESSFSRDLDILNNEDNPPQQQILHRYLRRQVNKALDERKAQFEKLIENKDSIPRYQERMKQHFLEHLGGFPEKSSLNSRTVDKKNYADYRMEKVLYESQPGFYVSGLFYLPDSNRFEPPYSGVLVLCGHSEEGKAYSSYQKVSILLAKHGFAVLCPDPIGQGERKQILTEDGKGKFPSTLEHNIEGVAPILMGENIATYMIWDAMRAVDYLVSRPEVDSSRIGCTGISGGGNRTSYMMALDERIDVASNGCFITTTRRKNESPGPGDAEQNIHGQIAFGMDHADYIHMRAPKPTLLLGATMDFVPIEGTWESYREAKRLYTRLDEPAKVSIVEAYEEHGYSEPLREATVNWMLRWFKNVDQSVDEEPIEVEPEEVLQCSPRGQTLLMPGARSLFDLYQEKNQGLQAQRKALWNETSKKEILNRIREVTGIRHLNDISAPDVEFRGEILRDGYRIDKVVLRSAEDRLIPGLLFVPEEVDKEPCLYLHGESKKADAEPQGAVEKLVKEGRMVLAVDLTGFGETQVDPWRYTNAVPYLGNNLAEYFIAYMLGDSFLGMRSEDILVSSRFLQEQYFEKTGKKEKVSAIAIGKAGPPALHAVALEEDIFHSVNIKKSLQSWADVVNTPVPEDILDNIVHGALRVYDLPDLVSVVEKPEVNVEEPVNARRELKTP
ncbi:MAG: alpha/beta hydrolase family protein [Bacteroidota bacterium]